MTLRGYVVPEGALATFWGSGDEAMFEGLAEHLFEELSALEQRAGLPAGGAEAVLHDLVISGSSERRGVLGVVDVVLTAKSPPGRLEDNAWSPVRASALDELDAALTSAGVPRNGLLKKLSKPLTGAAGRAVVLPDALAFVLPHFGLQTAQNLWVHATARMTPDASQRVTSLIKWWSHTTRLWGASSYQKHYDLLLVLA